jgi:hypothetical protein
MIHNVVMKSAGVPILRLLETEVSRQCATEAGKSPHIFSEKINSFALFSFSLRLMLIKDSLTRRDDLFSLVAIGRGEDCFMEKSAALSLKAIAVARKSEIERIIDGIHGVNGQALWTTVMRPSMRKDDPPEED